MEATIELLVNAFLLSLMAGLGTGVGGLVAIFSKPGQRSFGFLMGITAGVMISLAFLELVNTAWALDGFLTATLGFAAGALFMLVIDISLPHIRFGVREGPDGAAAGVQVEQSTAPGRQHRHGHTHSQSRITNRPLFMSGVLLALGITIHNLPEGIAVGAGYMHTPRFGMMIALAIMLHNIPEGIATALPLYTSGMGKWSSFRVALFSGLVEPIGAVTAALFLTTFDALVPAALAFAGGVMMFITLDELIPIARARTPALHCCGNHLGAIFVFLLSGLFGV